MTTVTALTVPLLMTPSWRPAEVACAWACDGGHDERRVEPACYVDCLESSRAHGSGGQPSSHLTLQGPLSAPKPPAS